MLYYLFKYLQENFGLSGSGLFQYISFRASMAIIISLIISMLIGRRVIRWLHKMQIGESVRDLGLSGQSEKKGTPTMGGVIIIAAIVIPTLLFARLDNVYVILLLISTIWMGAIGFLDDYIKVFKKDKEGLRGKFKILAQIVLGLIVGSVLYFHPSVKVRDYNTVFVYKINENNKIDWSNPIKEYSVTKAIYLGKGEVKGDQFYSHETRSLKTNVPFLKDNLLDYAYLLKPFTDDYQKWGWIIFIPFVIFIITAVSNASNLTDGIDGLAAGVSVIVLITLAIFAYVSGNIKFADYLNVLYIPDTGEVVIVCAALIGATIGFLWYNSFPANVFMGDTGSLMLGGVIATIAIIVRKELLIPVLCGIFFAETLSVTLQVAYFKYTKKRFGEGRRIFKMSPLHHHYQKSGYHEAKIVLRFWIISILLAVITFITLKIR
ncbi:MAG TPA: phospho-N-acetylmuramoyl-pentapeptide-transferase [Chitinophagales bacterium]|jgi:phospho-N-acetylmuramoyl-pentapeptide-transferase|nr:phospho-N-acetylmuramoyl-pentapeptide-transferase [Chitinophagales bacterium]MBP6154404.1 phospho-N-acetylmuramoyl-pentapeptide-transferase [Chitinophagales bacterium]HQV77980.1 phospho-N-acetylmuramoyl-pentapeptide-transferase [Chitinophagales bacterium]HQW78702.1 phospho-N-acetylmuramoyl-pentapeptide-transferase [Chitinophagales bacterium]HRB68045.1 phospho-N-acetylmuramoyl-pentapeptide-transferase [Chitinophagales bacterium]